jgi:hypothetical protein
MPNIRYVFVLAASVIVVACGASRNASTRGAACPLTQRDSAYLAAGIVYRDCAVSARAKLIPSSVRIDYRSTQVRNGCYTAEIEMVVDTLGKVEVPTAQIIRTNDRAFAEAALANISTWRFEPARIEGKAVRQIVLEKPTLGTVVVAVPAGSSPPPRGAGGPPRPPRC